MKDEPLDKALTEFYAEKHPPPALVERLVEDVSDDGATAPVVGGSPGRAADARFGAVALVAASLLLVVPAFYLGYQSGLRNASRGAPAVARDEVTTSLRATPALSDSQPAPGRAFRPRLVLARMHADWCPRCPTIAPIFEELTGKYGNEAVLFVTLDITDPQTQKQAMLLATSLDIWGHIGIEYNGDRVKIEPGMIRLIDREKGESLGTLRAVDEQPQLEDALAHALPSGATRPATP